MDERKLSIAGTSGGLALAGFCLAGPIGGAAAGIATGLAGALFGALLSDAVLPEQDRPWTEVASIIAEGETNKIEFKSSLLSKNQISSKIVCTLAAFANTSGGHMLIGVEDNREVCGIEADMTNKYKSQDKWFKALSDKIASDIGESFSKYHRIRLTEYQDRTVCQIEVRKANKKIYCNGTYYIRQNNQTTTLSHEQFDKLQSDD